jgi:hypothetical protein
MITDKLSAVISLEEATPIAFFNMYDEGDVWIKTKGCESCLQERRIKCCGNCPCVTPDGQCQWQVGENKRYPRKSFFCVVYPLPSKFVSDCCIEYKCTEGDKKGKTRRIKDKLNVFIEETP